MPCSGAGFAEAASVMARSAAGMTLAVAKVVLLTEDGSCTVEVTDAVATRLPTCVVVPVTLSVARLPFAKVGRLSTIVCPAVEMVPWLVRTEPMLTPDGMTTLRTTPAESDGPWFTTLKENVTCWPSRMVGGWDEAVTAISAEGVTVEKVLTVLLPRIGSAWTAVTVAVFSIWPVVVGRTMRVNVFDVPSGTLLRLAVNVVPSEETPTAISGECFEST